MNKKELISWLAVVFWLVVIFLFSAQPAYKSADLSKGLAEIIVKIVKKISPNTTINLGVLNHYLRKTAHFFLYLVLGILVMNVLRVVGVRKEKRFVVALLVCVLSATIDEFHQLFVPGRGGQIKDVVLDSIGALVGISIYWLRQNKKSNN